MIEGILIDVIAQTVTEVGHVHRWVVENETLVVEVVEEAEEVEVEEEFQ